MAVIGKIRKQSGLLIIIVGVALAAFVLGDFIRPGGGRRGVVNIGEIYGEEIPIIHFNQKVEQSAAIQKRNQQVDNLDAGEMFKIKDQVWKQLMDEIILHREYSKIGLNVSSEELFDLVQGDNPHPYIVSNFKDPETQMYNPELVRNYLYNLNEYGMEARQNWLLFEKAIKEDRYQTKYRNLLSKAYFMPDTLCYVDFLDKNISVDIRFAGVRFTTLHDSLVSVSDKEYMKHFNEKKHNYPQKPNRDINYVTFDVKPSQADREKIRKSVYSVYEDFKITQNIPVFVNTESDTRYDSSFFGQGTLPVFLDAQIYDAEKGDFFGPHLENDKWYMAKLMDVQFRPDSMKASHLLFSYTGAAGAGQDIERSKEEAEKMADSLFNVLKSNPGRLEELAATLSDDPSAVNNSGDLGWFADGAMVYPFNQAALEGKVNEITRAESPFGYHIIKVTGKKEPVKKVRVAIIEREIKPSNATFQERYAEASRFAGLAKSIEAFDTIAANMGQSVKTATYLEPMGTRIAGLEYPRPIIQWAHMDNITVGSVSPVFSFEESYIVAIVTKVREVGFIAPDELEASLRPMIAKDKKGDIILKNMQEAMNQTNDLYELARLLNTQVDTLKNINLHTRGLGNYGAEGKVIASILEAPENVLQGPVKGDNSAFFFIVDRSSVPGQEQDYTALRPQLLVNFTSKVNNNSFITTLEEKAPITDNRQLFY